MEFQTYLERKMPFEDAHTKHLHDKIESSLTGVVYGSGTVSTLASARKELDKMSASVKVTKTGFGMFQAAENKQPKLQEDATSGIQPNKPYKNP